LMKYTLSVSVLQYLFLKNFKKIYKIGTIQPKTRPHPPFCDCGLVIFKK